MPNKRPVGKVSLDGYLHQDQLYVNPKVNKKELHIEPGADRCRTIVLNEEEALSFLLTMVKQSQVVWGSPFLTKLVTHIEVL